MSQISVINSCDEDHLEKAFESDKAFQHLLKNGLFDDYFNTFLSLPVFAKRLMFRQDTGLFEIEPPIRRTTHHLLHNKVISWTRINRGHIFLKTGICNEYKLCAALLELPMEATIEPYTIDQLNVFKRKYLSKVIDMQRLKRYLSGSIGESLITFWLDAERFRRQVDSNCRRFVLKELQNKFLNNGAPYLLNSSVRDKIKNHLKEEYETKINSKEEGTSSTLLVLPQQYAMSCLQQYWIPKYIQHRLRRRTFVVQRWGKLLKKKSIADKVEENDGKETRNTDQSDLYKTVKELQVVMGKRNENLKRIFTPPSRLTRSAKHKTASVASSKRSINHPDQLDACTGSSSEYSLEDQAHSFKKSISIVKDNKEPDNIEDMIDDLKIGRKRKTKRNRRHSKLKDNESTLSMRPPTNHLVVSIRGSSAEESRGTKTEITQIRSDSVNSSEDCKIYLPPLQSPYANEKVLDKRKTTLFEALHLEKDYEADTEDDDVIPTCGANNVVNTAQFPVHQLSDTRLPMIKTLERTAASVVMPMVDYPASPPPMVNTPFSNLFLQKNMLKISPDKGKQFQVLLAALTTDPIAGNPLAYYFQKSKNRTAENNLKFWTASHSILNNGMSDVTTVRQQHYRTLVNLYLTKTSERRISLPQSIKHELCTLLPKDSGVTKLMEACDLIAELLLPYWEDFLKHDEDSFLKNTTKCKRTFQNKDQKADAFVFNETIIEKEYDGTFGSFDALDDLFREAENEFTSARMWRAVELAISICRQQPEILLDAEESDKWTTDDEENEDEENFAGSLNVRNLHILNKKAQRINHEKLEGLFNNPYGIGLVHDYSGASALFTKQFSDNPAMDDDFTNLTPNEQKTRKMSVAKPPRPRCFQDILNDPSQFDHFKRFLQIKKEEVALLFWTAVESMRTATKSAKARQGRAHGIVKRYFGPSTQNGKDLRCDAEIIKEIPYMEKVTPAMLMSAQACVAKSMEEAWFAKYLQTYQDDGGMTGVTLLPIYGQNRLNDQVRCVKQKSRGLWRMFTRNVISFRRGIMNQDTLALFRNFLKLQHHLNVTQFQATNDTAATNSHSLPPRIVVNDKLIYTDKLIADLSFWSEVERYKDFADAVVLCAKLGNYTKDDELVVIKKAKTIVDCFIESQITPRIQINISNDLAENVIHLVNNGIIERGLFHEAALSTFSTLIYFWKKFCLYRFLPKETVPSKARLNRIDRSAQIRQKELSLRSNKLKKVSLPPDEDCPKIMFSLQMGLRLALQRQGGRRKRAEQVVETFTSPQMTTPVIRSPIKTPVFH